MSPLEDGDKAAFNEFCTVFETRVRKMWGDEAHYVLGLHVPGHEPDEWRTVTDIPQWLDVREVLDAMWNTDIVPGILAQNPEIANIGQEESDAAPPDNCP